MNLKKIGLLVVGLLFLGLTIGGAIGFWNGYQSQQTCGTIRVDVYEVNSNSIPSSETVPFEDLPPHKQDVFKRALEKPVYMDTPEERPFPVGVVYQNQTYEVLQSTYDCGWEDITMGVGLLGVLVGLLGLYGVVRYSRTD